MPYQGARGGAPFPNTGILQEDTDEERNQDGIFVRLFINLADNLSRIDPENSVW